MEIRPLTPDDATHIRRIARESMLASFPDDLGAETIEAAIDSWYSTDAFEDYLNSDEMLFLVVADGDELIAFSQSHCLEEINKGRILWIHVHPDHRGGGVASDLLDETVKALEDRGIDRITALVLADHTMGNRFYENHGFKHLFDRSVIIAGEQHRENVYGGPGFEPAAIDSRVTDTGKEVYIVFDESDRGSDGPFYAVYRDPDRSIRYGWFCSACESLDTVMDTMGRIECTDCGNRRKPTRWDAAYL